MWEYFNEMYSNKCTAVITLLNEEIISHCQTFTKA